MAVNNSSYAGTSPWHFGTDVTNLGTSEEALKAANLDWTVSKEPLVAQLPEGITKAVRAKFTMTRNDSRDVIGIVGKNFRPVINLEAFQILDALAGQGGAAIESAGQTGWGERVWMVAKLPGEILINGDKIEKRVILTNAHDGSKSLVMSFIPFNTRTNTALNLGGKSHLSIRHTRKMDDHLKEAKRVLKMGSDYFDNLDQIFTNLVNEKITDDKFKAVLDRVLPIPTEVKATKSENAREKLSELWGAEVASSGQATGWGLLNAFASMADHHKAFKSKKGREGSQAEIRFLSIVEGTAQSFKNTALDAILAVA